MLDELAFYASPGPMTTLPPDIGDVPGDPAAVRLAVPNLMVHVAMAAGYGLPAPTVDARQTRTAEDLVREIRALDDRPLSEAREPAKRVGVVCRHFSTLSAAMLRQAGVPARARCGFGTYFEAGKHVDHWIVEHHDGERWVRSDCQIDEGQRRWFELDFDPDDMPAEAFLDAGEAWRRVRAGAADPETFGIFDMWGAWFIRANVWRDLAALNKIEMLPWDDWGTMGDADDPFTDAVADVAHAGDLAARIERYHDDALRMAGRVTSYTDAGPREVDVPVA